MTDAVRTAFGVEQQATLESGRSFLIPKWSPRKMIHLGESIARVVSSVMNLISREADDDGSVDTRQFIEAIPRVLSDSAEDFARIIEGSLTLKGGQKQITFSQIMGDDEDDDENLSWDEFAELAITIVNVNLNPKTLGKLKALAAGGFLNRIQGKSTP